MKLFENNSEYRNEEFDFIMSFEKKHKETLMFVSANSLTKVENPIYETSKVVAI